MPNTCKDCKWFDPKFEICRRYAPRTADSFPEVCGDDWCGEFESKEVPIKPKDLQFSSSSGWFKGWD